MNREFKIFRLKKLSIFPTLDKKKLYLATETNSGYTMNIDDGKWCGFPKEIVEKSPKVFEPWDRKKETRFPLILKPKNHV